MTNADGVNSVDLVIVGGETAVTADFQGRGWTDGLPIVAPTRERVDAMCAGATRYPIESLGTIAPLGGVATIQKVAVNAVMAGCVPEQMPVLEAAIEAIQAEDFNLVGMQTTTHPCALLAIVHGPVSETLAMAWGAGCMGHGNPANATIGRALRLVLQNIGGALPGETDRATQGTPAKYSWCFAENEAANPWPSFRESLGFGADQSCVTVAAAEGPHNINDHGSTSGEGILNSVAQTMSTVGNNNVYLGGDHFVVFGPEHARTVADSGFSRRDVQAYLYENARVAADRISAEKLEELTSWGAYADELEHWGNRIPMAREPESLRVLVAGGPGKHSCWIPTFGVGYSQSRAVQLGVELCRL